MNVVSADLHPQICEAIRTRRRLRFEYDGVQRVVEPYCHGRGKNGGELLRAIQINGPGRARGFGKLWTVSKIVGVELDEPFEPDDPNYNANDSALGFIHCCI